MDCYWITQAGLDPVEMLNRLGRRVRMLHIKDRKLGFPPSNDMNPTSAHFTEVGAGSIDWPSILALAKRLEVEHYFIEQDDKALLQEVFFIDRVKQSPFGVPGHLLDARYQLSPRDAWPACCFRQPALVSKNLGGV